MIYCRIYELRRFEAAVNDRGSSGRWRSIPASAAVDLSVWAFQHALNGTWIVAIDISFDLRAC